MAEFELTGAADRDLTEIYIYSYGQFGERQADDYLLGLESCFARLAEMADMGRSIEHIRAGYYRFTPGTSPLSMARAAAGRNREITPKRPLGCAAVKVDSITAVVVGAPPGRKSSALTRPRRGPLSDPDRRSLT
jgi:plasmid stabilization system protein ParE